MTARGSTPEEYYKATGETIGQAVARLHKTMGVEHAAHYVGFASATDLRRYLSRRGEPRGAVERDMGFGACVLAKKLRRVSTERAEAWWAEARRLEAELLQQPTEGSGDE